MGTILAPIRQRASDSAGIAFSKSLTIRELTGRRRPESNRRMRVLQTLHGLDRLAPFLLRSCQKLYALHDDSTTPSLSEVCPSMLRLLLGECNRFATGRLSAGGSRVATVWKRDTKNPSYTAQVRMRGHATRSKTFRRKTDAKEWAKGRGVGPSARQARCPTNEAQRRTLAELVDRYLGKRKRRTARRASRRSTSTSGGGSSRSATFDSPEITPDVLKRCRKRLIGGMTYRGNPTKPRHGQTATPLPSALSSIGQSEKRTGQLSKPRLTLEAAAREPRSRPVPVRRRARAPAQRLPESPKMGGSTLS